MNRSRTVCSFCLNVGWGLYNKKDCSVFILFRTNGVISLYCHILYVITDVVWLPRRLHCCELGCSVGFVCVLCVCSAAGWAGCVVTALSRFVGNFVVMTCSVRQSFFYCLCHRTPPTQSPVSTSCSPFPRLLTPATQTVS